ncbi:MAG: hypothetical protein GKS05_03400 [Nitrospirales bacterium]|nr:hypothetical protein [Nitrospirales bacterium]
MSLRRVIVLCVGWMVLVTGCTTPAYIAMKDGFPETVDTARLVIISTQNEIHADIEKSNVAMAMGGGLIPALIDVAIESSRADDAEATIESLRDILIDYDFGKALHTALVPKLSSVPWVNIQEIDIAYDKKENFANELLQKEGNDSLMVVTSSYSLNADFTTLKVQAVLTMYSNLHRSQDGGKHERNLEEATVYKNSVSNTYRGPNDTSSQEVIIKQWSENDGTLIKTALQESIENVANLLVNDLKSPKSTKNTL